MKTRIVALLGFVLAFGLVAPYAGNTTVAQAPADCAGVAEYLEAYHQVGQNYQAAIDRVDSSQVEDWTEADFTMVLTALDTAIAEVNALQTPDILVPLEEKALESLQSIKEMMTAVQTGDLMAAAPFIEQVNAATDELNAVAVPIEEHCQVAIIDNDNDGTPEIGLGTSGTPVSPALDPTAELGSYANPYPIGTAQATENNWTIQVDAVTPDGTELVLAENSFNTPPEEGRQFFIATITATYSGPGAESFDGNYYLRVRGAGGAEYTAFGDACGVTPNEWDEDIIVASGESVTGNLCWSVPTEELPYLRMFDDAAVDAGTVAFWSLGQEPTQ